MAGVSRSAAICIAYLMKYESMTLLEAYQHLKEVRPQIRPNPGFFEQLIEYEKKLYNGYATVNMISSSIGKIPDVYKIEQNSSLGLHFLAIVLKSFESVFKYIGRYSHDKVMNQSKLIA